MPLFVTYGRWAEKDRARPAVNGIAVFAVSSKELPKVSLQQTGDTQDL